jgi:hypothetical protein
MQTHFSNDADNYLYAILDGHGMYGHLVSNFVKTTLPRIFIF